MTAASGGPPGSVLYNRLRVELGISCQGYSAASTFSDCGAWRVVAGSTPADVLKIDGVVRRCLEDAAARLLPASALSGALRQALGATLIDCEDPVARAFEVAFHAVDGLVAESPVLRARRCLAEVDADSVAAAAVRVLDSYTAVTAA